MTTTAALTIRRYAGPGDLPGMVAVFNAMAEADGLLERRSVEQLGAWYGRLTPHMDPQHDLLIAEHGERIVGYGRHQWVDTSDGQREHRVLVFAVPDARHAIDPLLDAVMARAAEVATAQGDVGLPRALSTFVGETQTWRREPYERRGFTPIRWGFEMVRPDLENVDVPPMPEGIEVRPIGRDQLRQLWDADTEAFRDHWGGFDGSDEAFQEWLDEPDLDPSLFIVAWDGDEIAGAVLNTINVSENEQLGLQRGWLDSVFVRRPWRRRGLAAALVARSLVLLRERGMQSAILGVDAENPTGALGVYERAGFEVSTRDVCLWRAWNPRETA